jgi:hypothetical protein
MKKIQVGFNLEEKIAVAKRLCPILRIDKEEKYTPTNFVELFRGEQDKINFTCATPVKNWRKKALFDRETKLDWFAPTVYVHFLEDLEINIAYKMQKVPLIIQYWYYFAFNEFHWELVRVSFLDHLHDWELIQIAIDKHNKVIAYSISAHGTNLGIGDQIKIEYHMKNGFHCNIGAHNFGSIYQTPNKYKKNDIIIEPNTLIPSLKGERIPFNESLTFLDTEYTKEYLEKFSFAPVLAPWKRKPYNSPTYASESWTWSPISIITMVLRGLLKI